MKSQTAFQPPFHLPSSSGEATMQIETDLTREHRSVADQFESTASLAGLSLTFDGEILGRMGQERCWSPAQTSRSVTDLSGTVADPFNRNSMTPVAPPPMQPPAFFACGMIGQEVPIPQGNGMFLQGVRRPFPPLPTTLTSPSPFEVTPSCTMVGMGRSLHPIALHPIAPHPIAPASQDLPAGVRLPQRRGATQLWEFLLEMLNSEGNGAVVCWLNKTAHEFRVLDPDELARRWGELKGRPRMNYDKLSRSLRYYYQKKLLAKVPTEKYVYQFLCPPSALYDALGGRDKRKKSKAIPVTDQDDHSVGTLSPASGDGTPGESDSDLSVDLPSQLNVSCCVEPPDVPPMQESYSLGHPGLVQRLTAANHAKVTYTTLWRPPSPPSPSYTIDPHKQYRRHHPYPRQNSFPSSYPIQTRILPNCMKTQSTALSQQPEALFGPGLSLSLPANLHLNPFSVDCDQADDQLLDGAVTPESSAPQSPHSTLSVHSNDSDESETSVGLKELLKNFIEDENIDLSFCLDDMDHLASSFPVAAIASSMPPFS